MTINEIAKEKGVSERTARRKMAQVEPWRHIIGFQNRKITDYRKGDVKAAFKK
jgi:predicted transcriptional regulator